MSKISKAAVAASMALTIIGTSIVTAEAGRKERHRNLGLGIVGALVAGAIINENRRHRHADRDHYVRDCWFEKRRRWSNRRGRYVVRRIKVCD